MISEHETELLGAYVLGVLDGDEWASVQEHLDGCAHCRREVDDLRELEATLGEICDRLRGVFGIHRPSVTF